MAWIRKTVDRQSAIQKLYSYWYLYPFAVGLTALWSGLHFHRRHRRCNGAGWRALRLFSPSCLGMRKSDYHEAQDCAAVWSSRDALNDFKDKVGYKDPVQVKIDWVY